ncbi:MAG: hypothetical protein KOO60_04860 [Gemmatimonadales bacterium]|nr:hypothetical protein [Gemmatimonadales bacterium]
MKPRTILPWFLLPLLLPALTGCHLPGLGPASLSDMVPGMSKRMDKLECWVTIEFKKIPDGIDPKDVKLVFSSMALESDETFDWAYIAANDGIAQGMGKGYAPNEASDPNQPPPLKVKCKAKYPLRAKPRLDLALDQRLGLQVDLYWGGKKCDSMNQTIEHVYMPEFEK